MAKQSKSRPVRRQRRLRKQVQKVAKKVDSMFLGQVLSADGSCQNAVNETIVHQVLSGLSVGSANTAAYCEARQRLPQDMVRELARKTSSLLDAHAPTRWLWRGRHVKLLDGTTIQMPDTAANQEQFPQHGGQKSGAGFPIGRLVGVISLAHGAVLDVAMGPYQGKGTGEHGLFRELLGCFAAGDVMVADSYYPSYFLIAELLSKLRSRGELEQTAGATQMDDGARV